MPTILRIGPYRFFFYSGDESEPTHIHVERDNLTAKFWIKPTRLSSNSGFNRKEISDLLKIIIEHENLIESRWNEYFSG